MPPMGRKRTTNARDLPPGVRPIGGRFFWEPTSKKERKARRAAGLPATVPLGPDEATMRRKWAELMGYAKPREDARAGAVAEILDRYEDDVIPRRRRDGTFKLADRTRAEYKRQLVILRAQFGAKRYARTEVEAAKGGFLTTLEVQQWLDASESPVATNREFSLLRNAFKWARRWGMTFYNPCLGALPAEESARERVPAPWEREVLLACATAPLSLMLRHVGMTGWREGDTRLLHRFQLKPDGIYLRQSKRGARQLWEWTPELRALVEEAQERPEAKRARRLKEGSGYIYVGRGGKPLTLSGFQSAWRRLLARANRLLAEACTEAGWEAEDVLKIEGLVFHDSRAEAVEQADDPQAFAGHSDPRVTKRYLRSPRRIRPLER